MLIDLSNTVQSNYLINACAVQKSEDGKKKNRAEMRNALMYSYGK